MHVFKLQISVHNLTRFQMCVGWRGRRKWFVAMQEIHRIHSVDIHNLIFQDGYSYHDAPALVSTDSFSQRVTHIFIRHYRGWLSGVCARILSPSILTFRPSQNTSTRAITHADSKIFVTFAAGAKFKVYYNGELFLRSGDDHKWWNSYSAYVTVSRGGTFSFVMENCSEKKQFICCIGSNVCTGFNDNSSFICSREQPPDGWMLPSSKFEPQSVQPSAEKHCSRVTNESDIWITFVEDSPNHQCLGLSAFPAATDVVSCAIACCSNPACMRFQWCGAGSCDATPKCWIGHSTDCQRQMSGWVSGVRRSLSEKNSGWYRALPTGDLLHVRSAEVGFDKRAQFVWPPYAISMEPQMFCRYSIE